MTQSKTISVDGCRAHYLDLGRGEPVILLHGIPGDFRTWRFSIDVLASRYRVLALDLPGWGRSEMPRRFAYSLPGLAQHVHLFQAALDLEPASLVGLGLGGLVALETALRFPARTARVVVSGAPILSNDPPLRLHPPAGFLGRQWFKLGAKGAVRRLLARGYLDQNNLADGLVDAYARSLRRGRTLHGIALGNPAIRARWPELRRELAGLAVPTLAVWGEKDAVTPPENARFLADTAPKGALRLLRHAGHYCHEEAPAGFNSAVMDFLKEP
ncbi:MAG: alpha/beta fold hydrolase [Dehalococcoidia bacterium]